MTRRARRVVVSFCVLSALTLLVAAVDEPIDEVNLFIGEVAMLPTEPIESGDLLRLDVEVRVEGQGSLSSDPQLEIALRRQDKPEACITEVAVVPYAELQVDGSHFVSFAIDTVGLSGGRYELVVEIKWDGLETIKIDNRESIGFVTISDPRPELHPVELRTDPAVPLQWGETGIVYTTVANTGRLGAGAFHVVFDLRPDISTSAQEDPIDGEDCEWIRIASRLIPGLARNEETRVSAALDVAMLLENAQASAYGDDVCLLPDLSELRKVVVDFDLRVQVVYPTPDTESAVLELDPTNNEIMGSWRVVPSDLGRPDLVPLYITFDEDLPLNWDDAMAATVVVANAGGRVTEDGFSVRFSYRRLGDTTWQSIGSDQDDDGVADDRRVRDPLPIEVGVNTTRVSVTIDPLGVSPSNTPIEPGTYELRVEIDTGSEIAERNEGNNTLIVGFSVRGTELQAEGLELPSAEIRQGDSLIVKSWIVNTGDRPAGGFAVGFYLNDERFDTFVYTDPDGLQEDERTQVQGVLDTRDLPPSSYDLRVIVDPDNRVPEYDEGNNAVSMPIQIHPPAQRLAELHVTDMRLDPASPISRGSIVSCSLSVRNVGEIDAGDVRLQLDAAQWLSDELGWAPYAPLLDLTGVPVGSLIAVLERGEATSIRMAFPTADLDEGRYRLRASIDADNETAETDDSNNTTVVSFSIGEPVSISNDTGHSPNLTCLDVTVHPALQVEAGTMLTIAGLIANTGGVQVAASVVALRWMDPLGNIYGIDTQPVKALSPGQQTQYSFSVDTTAYLPGAQGLFLVVDSQNSVEEIDETDNECGVGIQIGMSANGFLPDLVPISVRFDSPSLSVGEDNSVERGQRLYAYVTVRNEGNIPSGSFNVAFETSLGVETESWTGIGPLDQVEVSHPMPTDVPGVFDLSIEVDADGLVHEENEGNNTILAAYTVIGIDVTAEAVIPAGGAAVRWMNVDESTDVVYAVSVDGQIRSIDPEGHVEDLATVSGTVQDVAWSFGSTPYAYVGTAEGSAGTFYRINLESGAFAGTTSFGDPIIAVALGSGGRIYVAIEDGFHELVPSGSGYAASRLIELSGDVRDILYDRDRAMLYVLSTSGVNAFGQDLSRLCFLDSDELVGTPSVLALAGSGIYVGTDAGTGGIVYAVSHCAGAAGNHVLVGWRFPATGTLASRITSIVIDPRDIDPIYVATEAGSLYSLGFDGTPQWVYEAGAAIGSTPLADKRTGRIFFGDDDGIPHVLTLAGVDAFDIDLTGYNARSIRSTLVIVETRERTVFGTRLVRNYYYGRDDGAVYKIASQQ